MKPRAYELWKVDKRTEKKIEHVRDVSIHESEAIDQNCDTRFTGILLIEKESNSDASKDELWEQINKMELGEVKKPHHASGIEKLQEFINEHSE